MSKLPNAPLLEVIFELKWDITNKNDVVEFQYLHGDLYSKLKDNFPFRENLVPPEIPFDALKGVPAFRFRPNKGDYPLIQIGLGVITVNTIDSRYYWEEFRTKVHDVFAILNEIYPKYKEIKLSPSLTYIDFFEYDKRKLSSLEFVNSNFQLKVAETFVDSNKSVLKGLNVKLNYETEMNLLSLSLSDGKVNNEKEGIVMQTKVIGEKVHYNEESLKIWLENAHELCSDTFKSLTKGDLYESFK